LKKALTATLVPFFFGDWENHMAVEPAGVATKTLHHLNICHHNKQMQIDFDPAKDAANTMANPGRPRWV